MSSFDPYTEPSIPERVTRISFTIISELVEDYDEDDNPLGTFTETEFVEGYATVVSQLGGEKTHTANDYQYLLDKGVFTPERLLAIQTILQDERDIIEGLLLPSS